VKGVELPVQERFKTTNGSDFSKDNFRRIVASREKAPADVKDLQDAA
jgi:hypothetical protein